MKKIFIYFIMILNISIAYGGDIFITTTGNSYSETRNVASRLASSQGMKIVGQNYFIDGNKKWHVIFQLRSRY